MTETLLPFQRALGYTFNDPAKLAEALVHSSRDERMGDRHVSNERLEFLGDRVINLCVAELLYRRFPDDTEGQLSRRHAALVKEPTLADIAKRLGMGEALKLGKGEAATGGRDKPSILADALEAVFAAVYLDSGGWKEPLRLVEALWPFDMHVRQLKDPKTLLQEYCQANGHPLPEYHLANVLGQAHARRFVMRAVTPFGEATGEGSSKQLAQQAAARVIWDRLKEGK